MYRAYKFRAYPNKQVEAKLLENFEINRKLYNYFLDKLNKAAKIPHKYELEREIKFIRREWGLVGKVYRRTLRVPLYFLYQNLSALAKLKKKGRKVGRLKPRKEWNFIAYQNKGFKFIKTGQRYDKIHLSMIGEIKVRVHREFKGEIKIVTITRDEIGRWFIILTVEEVDQLQEPVDIEKAKVIGLDMGVKFFLTDSEGRQIEHPHIYEKMLRRIKKAHKNLSRKKKGSNNYYKAKKRLAKLYKRIYETRDDFIKKVASFYLKNYDVIVVEDLNIKGMSKGGNRTLRTRILDSGWYKFFNWLELKCKMLGKKLIKVNPRGTSKGLEVLEKNPYRDYISACRILERGIGGGFHHRSLSEKKPPLRVISFDEINTKRVSSVKQEPFIEIQRTFKKEATLEDSLSLGGVS